MPIDNIYVLDLKQSFRSEPIHNLFTYNRSTGGVALDLINGFIQDVLPALQILQCSDILTESVTAYSLGDLGDLDEVAVNTPGGQTGLEMLPVFNALNFTLKPTSRAVRPGSKRFAGIPETAQIAGYITSAPYITAIEGLRAALTVSVSDDETAFFAPVVVKRVKYEVPDSDPVRFAYRYPETDPELVFATLRTVLSNLKISHQVSRGN